MKLTAVFNASGNDLGVEISGQNVSIETGAQMEVPSSDPCVGVDTKSQFDVEVRNRKLNVTIGNPILREGGGGGETNYDRLRNRPYINEHLLVGGENSLSDIGIGRANNTDIARLFS